MAATEAAFWRAERVTFAAQRTKLASARPGRPLAKLLPSDRSKFNITNVVFELNTEMVKEPKVSQDSISVGSDIIRKHAVCFEFIPYLWAFST